MQSIVSNHFVLSQQCYLILDALNKYFEHILLSFFYELKRLLCFLKLESVGDECLDIDLPFRDQIYSCGVATSGISDRTLDIQSTNASGCDWEVDILNMLARAHRTKWQ